jgi:hypothetical protein
MDGLDTAILQHTRVSRPDWSLTISNLHLLHAKVTSTMESAAAPLAIDVDVVTCMQVPLSMQVWSVIQQCSFPFLHMKKSVCKEKMRSFHSRQQLGTKHRWIAKRTNASIAVLAALC